MFGSLLIFLHLIPQLLGLTHQTAPKEHILAAKEISLDKRYPVDSVNKVFKDNILLNVAYMTNSVEDPKEIKWDSIEKPFSKEIVLQPNQVFAFHDAVLPQYKNDVSLTSHAHFNSQEGFLSDGYLVGDGVCHLASLMYWAAKDAELDATAPTNHDFMPIPEVPRKYGVAIYADPNNPGVSSSQNLYIKNTLKKPIAFKFDYNHDNLKISVTTLD